MGITVGHTRWRRFGVMMGIVIALAAALVLLTAKGVLAVSFAISGMPFTITSPRLHGLGFEQFAVLDEMAPDSPNAGSDGGQKVLIVSAINTAELYGLCQAISLGGTNLVIRAGSEQNPVTAERLVVDSDLIQGNAEFSKIDIGQDASTLTRVPGVTGGLGVFGQQAEEVTIRNLRQNNYATTAVTFRLPNLWMGFDERGC
ncbi:DUF6230 family protein [Actinoplanes derwentensis]|uniref:Cholesterol esterase n=1 Tax=Actinoplanes derwentensis TaxID=113562 RepID=A0A1H1RRF9_9ACTN|nr:DUF6230 family protein [Actinoplanes derwentensis]GID84501.1 cholesterol esterase [Actinoplanes derwentensis]SDS38331.1 hypothetical protein SAMN04489716_0667 [Actinoplanes derwentensis]